MFNLSGSEIIVILLLALVVLGPDKLPDAMRKAGKTFAELKKMSSGFQDEVRKGFEEPAREVRKTAAAVKSVARFPINTTSTTSDDKPSDDKPRYNPAVDAAPALRDGESVAEPLADMTAGETVEPVDAAEPDDPAADNDDVVVPAEASTESESTT